jgi:hypothetical protein
VESIEEPVELPDVDVVELAVVDTVVELVELMVVGYIEDPVELEKLVGGYVVEALVRGYIGVGALVVQEHGEKGNST